MPPFKMPYFLSTLLIFALVGLTCAQSSFKPILVTSGVSFNPTVVASTAPKETLNVYQVILEPLDTLISSWGARTVKTNSFRLDDVDTGVLPVSVNNHTSFPSVHDSNDDIVIFKDSTLTFGSWKYNTLYPLLPNDGDALNLGPSSVLQNAGWIYNNENFQTLTVPFALNVGQKGRFKGSLLFGGAAPSYDANRVGSRQWYILPGSENGAFLQSGTVEIPGNVTIQKYQHSTHNGLAITEGHPEQLRARLNFSSDSITVPRGSNLCQSNYSITFNVTTASKEEPAPFEVRVPAFPSGDKARCTTKKTNDSNIELGLPFFSLIYILVSSINSPLYLTLPNSYDLDPSPAVFRPSQTLVPPPSPPATTAPTASTGAAPRAKEATTLSNLLFSLLVSAFL
ncbi:hypothetical protein NUU61_003472 [Penicillium alfredii]|uniref:Peptidase A1 domain-containing protein n=1 Tax=Penicillium alfredii TaxID=1506179 RepID=A0A9W9KCE1_9EURO|nr:uncharacterized protein NUU61_003472 [Penicillium alfredii]KAJ5101250.1 hypothetical protein NUU61_003472 [Penicillium alfredii]